MARNLTNREVLASRELLSSSQGASCSFGVLPVWPGRHIMPWNVGRRVIEEAAQQPCSEAERRGPGVNRIMPGEALRHPWRPPWLWVSVGDLGTSLITQPAVPIIQTHRTGPLLALAQKQRIT